MKNKQPFSGRTIVILSLLMSLLQVCKVEAQDTLTELKPQKEQRYLFQYPKVSSAIFDLVYLNMPFRDTYLDGASLNMGLGFESNFAAMLALDFAGSRNVTLDSQVPVITPGYNYYGIGLQLEYLYKPEQLIYFSVPLKTSLAIAEYVDRYDQSDYYYSNGRTIADDVFFMAEIGANAYVNLFKFLALGGGVRYHWAYGVSRIGSDDDFRDVSWNVGIRCRLTNLDK